MSGSRALVLKTKALVTTNKMTGSDRMRLLCSLAGHHITDTAPLIYNYFTLDT